ncbi:MAG: PKD domain-containing protein, partial [Thermoplasmata archaeon]|nr:PKD domain-containing protein [Thermoplasmata archaeon]
MEKGIVHTRVVSTLLIVACIILSAGLSGYFLDLYKTASASTNESPTADAGEGPIYGYPTISLDFDGTGSFDNDGEIFSYEWDFGDGYAGIGLKPSHSYDEPGTYLVELKVTDNDGAEDIDGVNVIVSEDTDGTGMYTLLPIQEILTNGSVWYGKMVRVAYATVTDAGSFDSGYGSDIDGWVKFYVSDASTTHEIEVYCQGGSNRPLELRRGDQVNVSCMLDEYNNNWELNVRKDSLDRVTICPAIYNPYTLDGLLDDRMSHNGELIVIENLEIISEWTYGWVVTDETTTESISLYAEINANVSLHVNVSDIVTMQGVFTYYDYDLDGPDDDEWELKVRNAAQDMILRTWEYDYPPSISDITRTPEEPSPYDDVIINATVMDNIQVSDVSLVYALNGGTETEIDMTVTTDNFYEASIPAA